MNPSVSVVIPTYNSARFIQETLESVFAQTYRDYEVIVVDDGSTDNTREILQPYMSHIRYIRKQNGGPASARNVGIRGAKGDHIAFLDSDDLWFPEKLEKQMEYLQTNIDIALVYSGCIRMSEDGICQQPRMILDPPEGYVFLKLLKHNFIPNSTVVIKRDCFEQVGYLDESASLKSSEDYDMWLRVSRHFKVGYIQEPLAKYRVRNNSLNNSSIDRAYRATLAAIEKAVESIESRSFDKDIFLQERLFGLHFNWGLSHFTNDNFRDARRQFFIVSKSRLFTSKAVLYYIATFLPFGVIRLLRCVRSVVR